MSAANFAPRHLNLLSITNSAFTIQIETNPAAADVTLIDRGSVKFNRNYSADDFDYQPLVIFLRGAENEIVGGLLGASVCGWLEIKSLWVESHLRELGFGKSLLHAAETEAVRRNCQQIMLDTFNRQTLDFYRKLGYTMFGKLDDLPNNQTRYFLRKTLIINDTN